MPWTATVAAGSRSHDTGYAFTNRYSDPLHPGYLTHRFAALVAAAGLPPSACTTYATAPPPWPI